MKKRYLTGQEFCRHSLQKIRRTVAVTARFTVNRKKCMRANANGENQRGRSQKMRHPRKRERQLCNSVGIYGVKRVYVRADMTPCRQRCARSFLDPLFHDTVFQELSLAPIREEAATHVQSEVGSCCLDSAWAGVSTTQGVTKMSTWWVGRQQNTITHVETGVEDSEEG